MRPSDGFASVAHGTIGKRLDTCPPAIAGTLRRLASVVLPLKALLLNVLSLTAAFGALVWIFQDGHLGAFGTTATGTLVASVPVLLFCLAFGLSMDYEVFLISRIRESWLATNKTRADNDESVALLMAVTFASLVAADVSVTG